MGDSIVWEDQTPSKKTFGQVIYSHKLLYMNGANRNIMTTYGTILSSLGFETQVQSTKALAQML